MRFLIYGAGALGQALGCMLAAQGHNVTLIIRERFIKSITKKGLTVSGLFGDFHVEGRSIGLLPSLETVHDNDFDYILITTKSYGTAQAVAEIATLEHCSCPVVSMQNGCGNVEQVIRQFGTDRSLGARVITGFEIQQPAVVKITVSADDIHIGAAVPGSISQSAQRLANTINQGGLPTIPVEDINQSLFAKLLYNCALNPLGALLGVNYGALSEHDDTRTVMNNIIEETFSVISVLGGTTPWKSAAHYQDHFYQTLLPATYDHRSSMLQDLENNKPTEIEALTGYVSCQGKMNGISTPVCELLTSLIRFREQSIN